MFVEPTTFILGAGASWHYNYPTGEDLVKRLLVYAISIKSCYENELRLRRFTPIELSPLFFAERFTSQNNAARTRDVILFIDNFIERLNDVDPPVIDYFLGWNEDLRDLGKLLISWVILDCEREFSLKGNWNQKRLLENSPFNETTNIRDVKRFKDNWYRFRGWPR